MADSIFAAIFRLIAAVQMQTTHVALVGMGTVGTGVARLLVEQPQRLERHAGRRLELARVVVQDPKRKRDVKLPPGTLTGDLAAITDDPKITVVALLIGGLKPARTIMLRLLESGKDIVTANKALLAEHGPELFDRARELGRSIAFEASVAGGVPIVANISQCLSANQLTSLEGILNGTSNFIVSQMEQQGASYADAVAEAQRRGYAEADPAMDVDGSDAAQKLAILAHLAFGARVHWRDIPRQGIDSLQLADMQYARQLGYRIKLLAVAQLTPEGLECHVSPTLVAIGTPMAEVRGAYNAITCVGDAVGRVFFHGQGAGQMPTASAVVADLIDTAVGRAALTFKTLELWADRPPRVAPRDHAAVQGRYYLRFCVADSPSVLAQIAGILGGHDISIASVIQQGSVEFIPPDTTISRGLKPTLPGDGPQEGGVPLVIMTHASSEGAASQAVAEIDRLKVVRGKSVRLRVGG